MAAPSRQDREQKPDKKDAKALLRKEDRSTPQRDIGFMQEGGRGRSSGLPADRHRLLLKRLEEPGRGTEKADFFKSFQQSYGNHYVQRLVSRSASDRGASPGGRNAIPSGGGQPLDKPVRNDMEGRFGQSFSNVRVHTDVAAGNAARSLGARAFTTGQDIYFGRGAYQPASPQGRGLLAHELTHTIQQRGGRLGAQQALEVVPPDDPLEQQAEQASNAVMRDMRPAAPSTIARPPILRSGASVIQRQVAAAPPPVSANARAPVQASVTTASWVQSAPPALGLSGGQPLNPPLRRRLEKSFRADLGGVRVHGDTQAAKNADRLGAKAFAFGPNIVLGSGASADDVGLMAHEAAHTLQQRSGGPLQRFTSGRRGDAYEIEAQRASEAAVRGESFTVRQQTSPRMQGLFGIDISLPNPLNWLADKANIIPGFRMFTIILGVNPINMSPVARSAANILRALIEFLPGGGLITQALDNSGVFEKAGAFVEKQIASLGLAGSAIKAAVTAFISSLSLSDLANLGGVWERAKKIFTDPIDRIKSFGIGLVTGIVQIVKDAILKPIAKLAEGTNGYALLKAVMGRDPITGEPVPQTAEAIIEPFMKLIGQEEIWENMKKSNAIGRAFTWFKGALSGLMGFVNQIPGLFVAAFRSLEIMDIVLVPRAFAKLVGVFGGFLGKFISWAGSTIWNLLEIIFDAVSPGALGYIKKTGAALKSILKNPLPFVGNLVKAAKLGFTNFADNFGGHLKAGLIDWLTGSLSGVYIPKALSLPELGKFAMSVLGITWAQIRGKIVKALGPSGETIMKGLETGFDIVVALVTGGPAAAWELIKEKLTDLKDQVVSGIVSFVTETVVKKAVPKLIAMFIPGAGFISAILSIYDTIMVFVEKISKIIQVVTAFIDSIVTIAAGNISAAANRVESILGGLLSLAISFLAGFLGLGKVTDKIKEVIEKVRASVDKALDAAVNWIVDKAKKLVSRGLGGDPNATPQQRLERGLTEGQAAVDRFAGRSVGALVLRPLLGAIRLRHRMATLDVVADGAVWTVEGSVNPNGRRRTRAQVAGAGAMPAAPITANGSTRQSPIPLTWIKPPIAAYPAVQLAPAAQVATQRRTLGVARLTMAQVAALPGAFTVGPLQTRTLGSVTIGVTHPVASQIASGLVFQAAAQVSGNAQKDQINATLERWGYNRTDNPNPPTDGDHVLEKQLGGPDAHNNVWPLNSAVNQRSGREIRLQLNAVKQQLSLPTVAGKWFVLR